jgi:hypothetical protein
MDLFYDDGTIEDHVRNELLQDYKTDKPSQSAVLKPLTKDEQSILDKLYIYQQLLLLKFNSSETKTMYDKIINQYTNDSLTVQCIDGVTQVPIYKLDYLDIFKLSVMSKLPAFATVIDIKEGNIIEQPKDIFTNFKFNLSISKDLLTKLLSPLTGLRKDLKDNAEIIKKLYTDLPDTHNILVTITLLGLPKVYKYIFYKLTHR